MLPRGQLLGRLRTGRFYAGIDELLTLRLPKTLGYSSEQSERLVIRNPALILAACSSANVICIALAQAGSRIIG